VIPTIGQTVAKIRSIAAGPGEDEILPYDLRRDSRDARFFYRDLARITGRVIDRGSMLHDEIKSYKRSLPRGTRHVDAELILDFLMVGVCRRRYLGSALASARGILLVMRMVNALRSLLYVPGMGWVRALLGRVKGTLLLIVYRPSLDNAPVDCPIWPMILYRWIASVGDFHEEAKRLYPLFRHLAQADEETLATFTSHIDRYIGIFEGLCEASLGKYLRSLGPYLEEVWPRRKGRVGYLLCGKTKLEYYLNIVGAEIIGSLTLDEFNSAKECAIYLPKCMSSPEMWCHKRWTTYGNLCMRCGIDCPACVISENVKDSGGGAYIVSHRTLTHTVWERKKGRTRGIINVSCVPNLLTGALKGRRLGIPVQSAILDYCGCQHWCARTAVTNVYLKKIREILSRRGRISGGRKTVDTRKRRDS